MRRWSWARPLDLLPGILLNLFLGVLLVAASSIGQLGAGAQSWTW
jgi:hypothetical protein